jgi:glycosyltransferase involved in cell wall biosynthesis
VAGSRSTQTSRFAFVASNAGWGGSEELWSAAAAALAVDGHDVLVLKSHVDDALPAIRRLRALGCRIVDLERLPLVPSRLLSLVARNFRPLPYGFKALRLWWALKRRQPNLVVVSQGSNLDGRFLAARVRRRRLRYVLISQKATDFYWPYDDSLDELRSVYRDASCCYFVSEHNLRLTEEQLGTRLPRSAVVRNPFLVPWEKEEVWPETETGFRLACVGRLYPREKGQDLILRVLARDKWRRRPVSVTFFGSGVHAEGLKGMARFLGLESVTFAGFTHDAAGIWRDHHGLVLPSRAEGLPLVLVEAMLCGRVPIVTDVASAHEIVTDGRNGFLAAAPTEDSFDEAMERAWARRSEWRTIGEAAAAEIRRKVPPDPARAFADLLVRHAEQATAEASPG